MATKIIWKWGVDVFMEAQTEKNRGSGETTKE